MLIELDGKEHHKGTRDFWRDSFLLGEKHADYIIRFQGKDIVYNLVECCFILINLHPNIFESRTAINYKNLLDFRNISTIEKSLNDSTFKSLDRVYLDLIYIDSDSIEKTTEVEIHYKSAIGGYWKKFYDFAYEKNIYEIEELDKTYFR